MVTVPINFTGGDYQHKSRPLTKQHTRNFWPQQVPNQKAKSNYILTPFYGLKEWKTTNYNKNRGEVETNGIFYRVVDTSLVKVSEDGTHTYLGYISGSSKCVFAPLGNQLVIANGNGLIYIYDGTTLSLNTDPNLGLPKSVTVLNNQAIYDTGSGQGFDVSDVGKPGVINGLNNASAEIFPDNLVRPYSYSETLYLFGLKTTELWWNSGEGNPPMDRIQGATLRVGLGAFYSVAENPDYIFLFGSDKQVHTLTGGTTSVDTVISTPAMAEEFEKYSVTSDAEGWTMQLGGQWFYVLTFPNQDITWLYPVGGEWFQWGSGSTGRIRADGYVNVFNKHIVSDHQSGNLYELDASVYTDVGETIIRTRDTAPLHGGLIQADGKDFELNEVIFFLETGIGLLEGQGSNPSMAISFSKDGGKTFGTERFVKVGKLNDGRIVARIKNCGRFNSCVIRIRVSDPIYWCIYNGVAELEVCI